MLRFLPRAIITRGIAAGRAQAYPAQVLLFFVSIALACIVALAVVRHRRTLR